MSKEATAVKEASLASAPPPRARRTQRERSAAMRERLLDAAIDCLYELGYSGTTTIEVAARAGVSRGAQLHHFPTKEHLVTLAVRHVLTKRLDEFRAAFVALPEGTDKHTAAISILWEMMSSRTFYAWLELVVAARTDAGLRATIAAIDGQFVDQARATTLEFFSPVPGRERSFETNPLFALAMLQGLALDRIVWGADDPRIGELLRKMKVVAAMGSVAKPPTPK
jgi:AcrR family transcriptional regulator